MAEGRGLASWRGVGDVKEREDTGWFQVLFSGLLKDSEDFLSDEVCVCGSPIREIGNWICNSQLAVYASHSI